MTHDIDRTRLAEKAQHVIAAIKDLEALAIAGATQHERQLDMLREELAKAPTPADSMAVGLDDIRTILEEEKHNVVQELLVIEDDKVQVIDSLHQLLAHIIAVDTAWPASEMESLRRQLAWTEDELKKERVARIKEIKARVENHDADEAMYAEEIATITGKVRALAEAIRPINTLAAEIASTCDLGAGIDVVAQAVTELAGQIMDGGRGETAKALAMAQAYATQTEDEMHAIEAACEAGGMPPTIEREDIPAWLAEHLTTRVERKEKAKKAKKAKAPAIEADDDQGQLSILDEVSDA